MPLTTNPRLPRQDLLGAAFTALIRTGAPSAREVLVALAVPGGKIRWWRHVPAAPLMSHRCG